MSASEKMIRLWSGGASRTEWEDACSATWPQIVAVVEAAEAMHEWLYNERTSDEPPRALLDKGFVSMIDSPTYERDEEMDDKIAAALTALESALS